MLKWAKNLNFNTYFLLSSSLWFSFYFKNSLNKSQLSLNKTAIFSGIIFACPTKMWNGKTGREHKCQSFEIGFTHSVTYWKECCLLFHITFRRIKVVLERKKNTFKTSTEITIRQLFLNNFPRSTNRPSFVW